MKHILVIETVEHIGINDIEELKMSFQDACDKILGEDNNFTQTLFNQPSAIRGVYKIYSVDEGLSPDAAGSAK